MGMRLSIDAELDYHLPRRADVLLQLEAAQMPDQRVVEDKLTVASDQALKPVEGLQGIGRRVWTSGEGHFTARYMATVEVERTASDLSSMRIAALSDLPGDVIHFLWPSRYCQSDKLHGFAVKEFGSFQGGAKVQAIADWTRENLDYVPGCSDATTTAHDTFQQKKGICRDFAHVMISLARALDIPARMVSAYAWGLKPPDFHAVVEVWLDGGWQLVDPTGLAPVEGLVRIGVGRDATDISFMTIFGGSASLNRQSVRVQRLD
ncbi:MAG TPA: transglutaminase family protein [Allosphingosinicella sp.]|uniref:transglutaminase-like domain-containing protein n=1 Tax=Allosphingosinicella sp. TaxID=2823234 RepID=UPI002ED77BEE